MPSHYVDIGARSLEGLLISYGIGPLCMGALTLLLLPVVLLLWCGINGTYWITPTPDNPTGHGLISPINLYLVIVTPLNYYIFSYYVTAQAQLDRLKPRLPAVPHGPFASANEWGLALTIVAWSVAIGLAIGSLRKKATITNWLRENGTLRGVAYYFNFVFFVVQLAILFNWFLRHIFICIGLHYVLQDAQLDAFAPDLMLGLGPLDTLIWSAFATMSMVALLVTFWLVGGRVTLRSEPFSANPGHLATAVGTPICGTLVVLLPLLIAHAVMERKRAEPIDRLVAEVASLSGTLERSLNQGATRPGTTDLDDRRKALEALQKLYADADRSTTWPVSAGAWTAFPVGILSPLSPLLAHVTNRLLRRWRAWQRTS